MLRTHMHHAHVHTHTHARTLAHSLTHCNSHFSVSCWSHHCMELAFLFNKGDCLVCLTCCFAFPIFFSSDPGLPCPFFSDPMTSLVLIWTWLKLSMWSLFVHVAVAVWCWLDLAWVSLTMVTGGGGVDLIWPKPWNSSAFGGKWLVRLCVFVYTCNLKT